jgi:putative transposase
MCRALGVNRTSFHDWERRAPSDRALSDAWLTERIKQIHAASDGTYGARRVHAELRLEDGIHVGRKRVERLMRAAGISGVLPRKRRRTTVRMPGLRVPPDLVERDFRPDGPNLTWSADITYISTWEGFLYLAHVQDLFSRLIVGWSMADHLRSELVVSALEMALYRRCPERGLIHHSDMGCQYTAVLFTKRCEAAGIEISIGSVGDCYDTRCSLLTLHVEHVCDVVDVADGDLRHPLHPPRRLADMSTTVNRNGQAGFVVSAKQIRPTRGVSVDAVRGLLCQPKAAATRARLPRSAEW